MKADKHHTFSVLLWPVLLVSYFSMLSCSPGRQDNEKAAEVKSPDQQAMVKPGSSFNDTLIVKARSVVFFDADSVQLEKFNKVVSPMVFESTRHDCLYQMRNSRTILKTQWPGIEIREGTNKRFVLFVKEDGSNVCIDTDKLDVCGVLLFNMQKDPQAADMTNFETALKYYFEFQN